MKAQALVAIAAFAAACGEPVNPPPDPEAAVQVGESEPLPHALPPPNDVEPRFVGHWATAAEGCEVPAWRFEAERMSTRGEVSCTFDSIEMISAGYTIDATCTAEGPPTPHRLQLTFAESARAMMIDGGPWSVGTALVYCGPLTEP